MRITCRQVGVIHCRYFLYHHGSVRKLSGLPVISRCAGRSVCNVQLVSFRIEHCIGAEELVTITKINRLADVSVLVDQFEAVEVLGVLGAARLIRGEGAERENRICDVTRHILYLISVEKCTHSSSSRTREESDDVAPIHGIRNLIAHLVSGYEGPRVSEPPIEVGCGPAHPGVLES